MTIYRRSLAAIFCGVVGTCAAWAGLTRWRERVLWAPAPVTVKETRP